MTCLNPTLRPETLAAGESLIVARRVAVALLSTGERKFGLQSDAVNCRWRFEVQKGYGMSIKSGFYDGIFHECF